MSTYVPPTEQLVTEVIVSNIRRSVDFYVRLGFRLLRDDGAFVELSWEDHRFFLDEQPVSGETHLAQPLSHLGFSRANIRVMVPNVDEYWKLANENGAPITTPVADRDYGLRDFIIADPDGFGVRFATWL